jgi:hypothetical protein
MVVEHPHIFEHCVDVGHRSKIMVFHLEQFILCNCLNDCWMLSVKDLFVVDIFHHICQLSILILKNFSKLEPSEIRSKNLLMVLPALINGSKIWRHEIVKKEEFGHR